MPACSQLSRLLDEPLAGTAPVARTWLLLEQPGPWGRQALTQSHLDPILGAALETAANAHGARAALIRRPGRHPDVPPEPARRVWIAHTRPRNAWLLGGFVEHVAQLGDVSWAGIERGDLELVHESMPSLLPETEPLLLVCTNGRRDVCCASYGRPVVTRLHHRLGERTWETTHLGGHRFAPTAAVLPYGVVYGRVDVDSATRVVEQASAGQHELRGYRGRSTFDRPAQVAEAAVREQSGVQGIDDLDVASVLLEDDESWRVVVTGPDGRRWTVDVRARRLPPPRPESCGGPLVEPAAHVAETVVED
ncbi:MAG: sucrase ferredoxin [Jiangellaceae bacterium]|nr:sucrase ferredoxin [Jiangellaceae bacterium]